MAGVNTKTSDVNLLNGDLTTKQIAKYIATPEILPRLKHLFSPTFGYIAFLMANIYNMVRLLPTTHPYLNPQNIGKYGIVHVVGEAANNIVLKWRNADQILIFFTLLAAIVILLMQILVAVYGYIVQPAMAQAFLSFFNTPNPQDDIALNLLARVFGLPGIFCDFSGDICTNYEEGLEADGTPLPTPFHTALHSLFEFYSLGLLIVGVLILFYFIFVIVGETATTGSPFGQRFQNVWVPIRLVMVVGLLLPLPPHGINSAQYIVLYTAKYGSGFATFGWKTFNNTIRENIQRPESSNPTGETESLIAFPASPDITPLVQAMSLVHACAYAEWHVSSDAQVNNWRPPSENYRIRAYMTRTGSLLGNNTDITEVLNPDTTYEEAVEFFEYGDIVITFGEYDESHQRFREADGYTKPYCGRIRVNIVDLRYFEDTAGNRINGGRIGADALQEFYFNLVRDMWHGTNYVDGLLIDLSQRYMAIALNKEVTVNVGGVSERVEADIGCENPLSIQYLNPSCNDATVTTQQQDSRARMKAIEIYQSDLDFMIKDAWETLVQNEIDVAMTADIEKYNWGGAGNYYNTFQWNNGTFVSSTYIPTMYPLPDLMQQVKKQKSMEDTDPTGYNIFAPFHSNNEPVELKGNEYAFDIATAMNDLFVFWNRDDANQTRQDKVYTGNPFEDAITRIFGPGIFAMRGVNAGIHPMAQLTALGKGLVDSAIRNIGDSTGISIVGGIVSANQGIFGKVAEATSSFLSSTAFIGLTAGVILYYVLPFMPFIYFFFSVGEWCKAIFEAMVGVPLWALAHLRLDGDGLPPNSASDGYYLIFDIFLRPITTTFGLIASMICFTAQIRILNVIWDLAIDNLTGHAEAIDSSVDVLYTVSIQRGSIDSLFFTVTYALVVYMAALFSFKLIDRIPDNLLRWMGSGASSLGDFNADPTENLIRYVAISGVSLGRQTTGAIQGLAGGLGQAAGASIKTASQNAGQLSKNLMKPNG